MKNLKKKFRSIYLLPLLLIVVLAGCSSNQLNSNNDAKEKTVKIGVIAPLSGDAAAYGEQVQRIVDYYLPKINERYKSDNLKFEVIYEDGKCSGNDAVSSFQKLTDIDGVKFIVGGVCSSETLAIAPLTKNKSVLVLSPLSSNVDIEGASSNLFTLSYRDDVIGDKIAEEMSKYNRVAVLTEQNDYNVGLQKNFSDSIKKYSNVEVVSNETFPKGATDFRSVLEKIKKQNPEAIFLNPNAGATAQGILKQLAEMSDWNGYQLVSQYSYASANTLEVAPSAAEGMIIVDAPGVSNQELLSIKDDIENNIGTVSDLGSYYVASTIDSLNIFTSLISELGDNTEDVREALVSRKFQAYIGNNINFNNSNFVSSTGAAIYVVKDGVAEIQ